MNSIFNSFVLPYTVQLIYEELQNLFEPIKFKIFQLFVTKDNFSDIEVVEKTNFEVEKPTVEVKIEENKTN